MRNLFNGLCLVGLLCWFQPAAALTPSLSGTTIPSAPQIVDSNLDTWTLSGGQAYVNGNVTPSSEVILLLSYGGIVFQENIHHDWWLWDSSSGIQSWVASSDPRVISPSGTTIPAATQIVDSDLDVWTVSGGGVYEKGKRTPSSDVILLLYAKGIIYQENIHHDWWSWRNGAWVATAAPSLPSASGTAIPTAAQIVDDELDVWTVSGGQAYENHALTPSSEVILLLFYGGAIYQENVHHNWWQWNGHAWISRASDPRAGQPMVYIATCSPYPCSPADYSVTVVDTGTNRVTGTIPMPFTVDYMAVSPDAKHVYVTGFHDDTVGKGDVAVIDTAQKSVVASIPLPHFPQGIIASPDGTKIYVVCSVYGTVGSAVSIIETGTNTVVATIDLPGFLENGSRIAISPDGKELYVPGEPNGPGLTPGAVYVLDTSTHEVVSRFTSPPYEYFENTVISPDDAKLYAAAYYGTNSYPPDPPKLTAVIAVFDPATGAVTAKIPGIMVIEDMSPDSRHLYGVGLNGVAVIDAVTDVPVTAVANLPGADNLAITPDGKHLYITNVGDTTVMVADTATYTISTILSIGAFGPIAIVPAH
jgi:YVTN family beta-propeller protein